MHPLLSLVEDIAERLSKQCDAATDPTVGQELAHIGIGVIALGENLQKILHILAHVPKDVRLKAAEDAAHCDHGSKPQASQNTDAVISPVAPNLH